MTADLAGTLGEFAEFRKDAIREAERLYANALSGAAAKSALHRAVRDSI